ncbi:MAG: DUF1343 domain-containing protein [Polyangiaceae bacterium]
MSETTFTPTTSVFEGQRCRGVSFTVTSARDVPSVRLGIELAVALRRLHPAEWKAASLTTLLGHEKALTAILAGEPADRVIATFERDTLAFAERRKAYLLY